MFTLLTGAAVLIVTGILFWIMLPRGGKVHRFVGTELESYVAVAFCAAIALSCTMMLSGVIDFMGTK